MLSSVSWTIGPMLRRDPGAGMPATVNLSNNIESMKALVFGSYTDDHVNHTYARK